MTARAFAPTPMPWNLRAVILLWLCSCALIAGAQTKTGAAVRGTVIDDSTGAPLEFANVLLLRQADSSMVEGTATDAAGKFEFKNVQSGNYLVRCGMVGHHDMLSAAIAVDSSKARVNLKAIRLYSLDVPLDEVTVTADRPEVERSVDRITYNVDQDILSKTASASELLENIPSVNVDLNGEVSLRGSKRVLIMINGKRSPMLEKQEGTFLEQLPASSIEKIDVITTPSARYRSEGKSGIINIILKKDAPLGTHGNLTLHAGTGGRRNGNLRLSYSPGPFSAFASYSIRRDNRNRASADVRTVASSTDPALSSTYDDSLFAFAHPVTHLLTVGSDVHLDAFTILGVSGSFFQNSFTRSDSSHRTLYNTRDVLSSEYDRTDEGYEIDKATTVSVNLLHNFGRRDHRLRIDAMSSGSPETDDYRFTNTYLSPTFPQAFDNSFLRQRDDKNQVAVEYTNAISRAVTVEAGYMGEFSRDNMDYSAETFDPSLGQFVADAAKSSSFRFHEAIHSEYVTYKQSFGPFGVLGGLRMEQDYRTSDLVTADSVISRHFINLFPSLHLSYAFDKMKELRLSYSRRISRPKAKELNPFAEYRDPKNLSYGNPSLVPEFIHSVELGVQLNMDALYLFPSLFYRHSTNGITSLKHIVNRSTLVTTKENVSSEQSAGLELIGSADVGSRVSLHASSTALYEELDANNLGAGFFKSRVSWNGTFTAAVKILADTKLELHSHFNTRRFTPQAEYSPTSVVNAGLRQELFEKKVSITATVYDLFNSLDRQYELDVPGLRQTIVNKHETRFFHLGFTYHLGSVPAGAKDEDQQEDDDE
jgi:outer membrane receptor protein involved in Fe transport